MKANLKGLGGIKGLFLLHGEKIAIAVVGLLVLWFIYSSISLPRLDDTRQADKLRNEIQLTNNAVTEAKWPDKTDPNATEVRWAGNVAKVGGDISVPPEAYVTSKGGFNPPVVTPTVPRTDPVLLNAIEVRAVGGTGILAFLDEAVRQARDLARRTKDEQRMREERDKQRRDAEQQAQGRGPRGYGEEGGRGGAYGEGATQVLDPDHPNRRLVEGMTRPAGAPIQGDERQERVHWAIVTAKVPIREQLKLYQDAFENARGGFDPSRDFPRYVGYKVQRAEVVAGKQLEWKDVPVYDGQRKSVLANDSLGSVVSALVLNKLYERITKFWATQMPDVVDQRFLVDVLALPLPPLVGRDWGAEATHPDIPLLANTPPLEEEIVPLAEAQTEQPADGDEESMFRSDPAGQAIGPGSFGERGGGRLGGYGDETYGMGGRGGYGMGGRGGYGPGGGRGEYGMGGRGGYGMGGRGGYGMGGYDGERGGYGAVGGRAGGQPMTLPRGVDYWLLRFFDFSVEPGKKYRYQVRLVLADPNAGIVDRTMLAPAVLDRLAKLAEAARAKKTRPPEIRYVDDWSAPSRTVGIPLEGSIKLAAAEPVASGRFADEPTVSLLVESFDVDASGNAIQAGTRRDFKRGYVANMVTKDQKYLGGGGTWIDELESFKFFTGMTVLDMDGGDSLGKDATAPARVLLMDPTGELHIRSEMDDKPDVDYHKMIFETKRPRGQEGDERSPYGAPGGEYGGGRRGDYGT